MLEVPLFHQKITCFEIPSLLVLSKEMAEKKAVQTMTAEMNMMVRMMGCLLASSLDWMKAASLVEMMESVMARMIDYLLASNSVYKMDEMTEMMMDYLMGGNSA